MPRKAIYFLITKLGPTVDEQRAIIRKAVKMTSRDQEYSDDLTERYRRRDKPLEGRQEAIEHLRRGDLLVIATPGRLGVGRDDVRETLLLLAARGNGLLDASTGATILWTPEVAAGVEFLDRAVLEKKRGAMENARLARRNNMVPKVLAIPRDLAEMRWHDPVTYPDKKAVADACQVSVRTLYNQFGPRDSELAEKRKRMKR